MSLDELLEIKRKPKKGIVISASRTKDLIRCNPNLLSDVLDGAVDARYSWSSKTMLNLGRETIHTLVLWTKDPSNLMSGALRRSIEDLQALGTLIDLQLTVTGFGGTPVELGCPSSEKMLGILEKLVLEELIDPELVTLRIDPLLSFVEPGSYVISNSDFHFVGDLIESFAHLVDRVTTSFVDSSYRSVGMRCSALGLELLQEPKRDKERIIQKITEMCKIRDLSFHVCGGGGWTGCINAMLYNEIAKKKGYPRGKAEERLHNELGRQREGCSCTHSRDIGFTQGFQNCFSKGIGCAYCYSQGMPGIEMINRWLKDFGEFDGWGDLVQRIPATIS